MKTKKQSVETEGRLVVPRTGGVEGDEMCLIQDIMSGQRCGSSHRVLVERLGSKCETLSSTLVPIKKKDKMFLLGVMKCS
jgi:hypothetical protein